ncbi:MAG: N-acetylmuramic acid 6-phosphate etherase [Myxococcota bacterium]
MSLEGPISGSESPTEGILDDARDLDQKSVAEVLELMHREVAAAHAAVGRVLPTIAEAVHVLACSIRGGGRWFNVGAGTSGRLGVLDASEIPPTFGMSPDVVQGVIAGGDRALREAVEGAEDNAEDGAWQLRERGLAMADSVVAISASGRTPFVLGAFEVAQEVGARRIAISCNADSPLVHAAEIAIVPQTGPEVVAGSTRLKGGLAQKMVLHLLSTTVMVQLGRVQGNLMTNVTPVSEKLRERAVRIVMQLASVDPREARRLLDCNGGSVPGAVRDAHTTNRA